MRYYAVMRNEHGRPYIEAEVTEPFMIEDYSNVITREELQADPELARAFDSWTVGDDRLKAVEKAREAIKSQGQSLIDGSRQITDAAGVVGDVDDFWCEAVRSAAPHLEEAERILEKVLDEAKQDQERNALEAV